MEVDWKDTHYHLLYITIPLPPTPHPTFQWDPPPCSQKLKKNANHGAIVSKMTKIWMEMHEYCLDNIYLSTLHPLCGN